MNFHIFQFASVILFMFFPPVCLLSVCLPPVCLLSVCLPSVCLPGPKYKQTQTHIISAPPPYHFVTLFSPQSHCQLISLPLLAYRSNDRLLPSTQAICVCVCVCAQVHQGESFPAFAWHDTYSWYTILFHNHWDFHSAPNDFIGLLGVLSILTSTKKFLAAFTWDIYYLSHSGVLTNTVHYNNHLTNKYLR